jgi:uncharacterized membrane protein
VNERIIRIAYVVALAALLLGGVLFVTRRTHGQTRRAAAGQTVGAHSTKANAGPVRVEADDRRAR